jgi:DNA-binding MarR family transcriptional regulator
MQMLYMHVIGRQQTVKMAPKKKTSKKTKADPLAAFAQKAMEDCLCMRARIATRRIVDFYEARLASHGLGISQFGLMGSIAAEEDAPISALAEKLELDPSTLSRTLRPLEDQGWIEIHTDPANLRVRRVRLTKEGRARLEGAGAAWAAAQKEAAKAIDPALVAALLEKTEGLAAR